MWFTKAVDGVVWLTDGTKYRVTGAGQWIKTSFEHLSQRDRRKVFGKYRRHFGLSRSVFDRTIQNVAGKQNGS